MQQQPTIGILFNPASGYGKSAESAARMADYLKRQGYNIHLFESKAAYNRDATLSFLREIMCLVIAGGDGTVMRLLPFLNESKVPFYVLPVGTESLFSKKMGMSEEPEKLVSVLKDGGRGVHHYANFKLSPNAETVPFFLMASLGLDSQVIARIARDRSGPIKHSGYVLPTLLCALHHEAPRISLNVDGQAVLCDEKGFIIFANGSEYARNIGLVPEADTKKPSLHARFFPGAGLGFWLKLVLQAGTGGKADLKFSKHFCGKTFELLLLSPYSYPVQADGEFVGVVEAGKAATFSSKAGEVVVLEGKGIERFPTKH